MRCIIIILSLITSSFSCFEKLKFDRILKRNLKFVTLLRNGKVLLLPYRICDETGRYYYVRKLKAKSFKSH